MNNLPAQAAPKRSPFQVVDVNNVPLDVAVTQVAESLSDIAGQMRFISDVQMQITVDPVSRKCSLYFRAHR